jgi:hypothetical protein
MLSNTVLLLLVAAVNAHCKPSLSRYRSSIVATGTFS